MVPSSQIPSRDTSMDVIPSSMNKNRPLIDVENEESRKKKSPCGNLNRWHQGAFVSVNSEEEIIRSSEMLQTFRALRK